MTALKKSKKPCIVITGATSGFGLATARVFANMGWYIVGTGRREERLNAIHKEFGENFLPLNFDITDHDAVLLMLMNLPEPFNTPDVLVNNAGLALGLSPAHLADPADWDTMINTNIKGLMYATRAILPGMVARKKGHIINLGSIAGTYPYPGGNVYGASKAFVEQFSLNLRADLSGTGVRVTNIEPGLAESEFSQVRFKGDIAKAAALYEHTEALQPEDIAETIRWAVTLPAHVNINRIEVMPTCQSSAALTVSKQK